MSLPALGVLAAPKSTRDNKFLRTAVKVCKLSAKPWPVIEGMAKACSNKRVVR